MKLLKERHVSVGILRKIPKALVDFQYLVLFCSCSEEQDVSLSVMEVSFLTFLLIQMFVYFGPPRLAHMEGGRRRLLTSPWI